ncbi:MAG: tandem-95 repeat protein, partial [Pirellulaceae bacterium]|nr:tandem-95 repeat protein [Pirellulaceae bacterium]
MQLEPLEERQLLATFTVTSSADSGTGTLRAAVTAANSSAGPDLINFDFGGAATTITLTSNLPQITDPLTVDGTGQNVTVNRADSRIFDVVGAQMTVRDVTLGTLSGSAIAVFLTNAHNSLVDRVRFTPSSSGQPRVLSSGSNNVTVQNSDFATSPSAVIGVQANGGSDIRLLNNDFSFTNRAFELNGVTAGSLPGGVDIRGNDYTGVTGSGLSFANMRNLTIAPDGAANVDIRDQGGNETLDDRGSNATAILLNTVTGVLVRDADLSGARQGIDAFIGHQLEIRNVDASHTSSTGIIVRGGTNLTVEDNDLSVSQGTALIIENVTGITVRGNDYSSSATGINLINMGLLEISDGSVSGTNVDVTDGAGNQTLTTTFNPLVLSSIRSSRVSHIDVSGTGGNGIDGSNLQSVTIDQIVAGGQSSGIRLLNGNTITITCSSIFANLYGVQVINATGVVARDNNISGNNFSPSSRGMINGAANPLVDARGNFWGAVDGPSPPGSGDQIEGNIDASGFLTLPSACTPIRIAPPDAVDDTATTDEEVPVVIDVLANDTDVNNEPLRIIAFTPASNGTVVLDTNGTPADPFDDQIRYTPNTNFSGSDTFTYEISNLSGLTDTALVTVTVNSVNDPPVAVDDAYATDEDVPLVVAAPGILVNDSDLDGDALTVVVGSISGPGNGTLAASADGSFVYTPAANFHGTDSFTYR